MNEERGGGGGEEELGKAIMGNYTNLRNVCLASWLHFSYERRNVENN